MNEEAKMVDFAIELKLNGNTLSYTQEMTLDNCSELFNYKDTNMLTRIG